MTTDGPWVFRNRLLKTALHLDFLRLRCGSEQRFRDGIRAVAAAEVVEPHVFATLSEWDAVVALPCQSLYPEVLTSLYANADVASSISGNAGYFAYLWEHEINVGAREDIDRKLCRMVADGIGTLASLRFDDRIRRELGLGAELLFCDFLYDQLRGRGIDAVVAHTLGWNDVVVLLHTTTAENRLLDLLGRIRLLTLGQCLGEKLAKVPRLQALADNPIFIASYTHLICSYARFIEGSMALGALATRITSATIKVRAIPSLELELRQKVHEISRQLDCAIPVEDMPGEMGHYSFSVTATDLARSRQGHDLLALILDLRQHIGRNTGPGSESYAETSTKLRFDEELPKNGPAHPVPDPDLQSDINRVRYLLVELPRLLSHKGVSTMTKHRFNSVLVTLLDNLSDPVRSSVVRHLTRFIASTPRLIAGLEREDIDDLCHVCEYAVMQATDGIAQFQHDAASLGLTGRGGYSRLILAMETYMRDLFKMLNLHQTVPLLTFGLRTGARGSTGRFQTDVSFNTVFVPSSWYILVHEAGHSAWMSSFSWVGESLATYEALEADIEATVPSRRGERKEVTRVELIRTRDIVRELFANYLVYKLTCSSNLLAFDRLSLRHILRSRFGGGAREVLVAVVLHCLLKMLDRPQNTGDWWSDWDARSKGNHKSLIQDAIDSVNEAMSAYIEETQQRAARSAKRDRRERAHRNFMITKQRLMKSNMFHERVLDALQSVLRVLALSSVEFSADPSRRPAQSAQFAEFQQRLTNASRDAAAYEEWHNAGFGKWLAGGEVLVLAPPAWVWSKLLLESRDLIHDHEPSAFLRSQLSVILSIWHRAATIRADEPALLRLEDIFRPLDLMEGKKENDN